MGPKKIEVLGFLRKFVDTYQRLKIAEIESYVILRLFFKGHTVRFIPPLQPEYLQH